MEKYNYKTQRESKEILKSIIIWGNDRALKKRSQDKEDRE